MIDGPPARIYWSNTKGMAEIWNTDSAPVNSRDTTDRADIDIVLSPIANGSKFRFFTVNPDDVSLSPAERDAQVAKYFAGMGAAHERIDTARHAAMHLTKTVDYIILLSGEVTLVLDEEERDLKPFDVVVQRGTNHAWVCKGKEPALLIAVLVDADID